MAHSETQTQPLLCITPEVSTLRGKNSKRGGVQRAEFRVTTIAAAIAAGIR
jgi:hypothetical protein